ncbi:50S ribosomal protein L21 [Candidatus Uhrbacteria bacterium CG_4_10_14_0_8_um_filter_58_22]|uniref:Large ribosomal subunit protein bL21 n=1 Tax=Candidatus Uhrbacteria bacterium CG_4_10_14_0_8_um_filter_58_22 TaxID=1975029 RepID=A0A2M7QBZ7_9BACT|nr:MAG: 50S ribosomal protein L21 [Parcubacteria group bacterium CG1_02_58_44]PIY63316.1 MAG: 50S ribosomal protein L21 [Candidatus Uhrbacteria bacterium CG_4_10_14_0_8_um_filter_58_22]
MAQIAVIETGGKQYIVKPGDVIRIEKLEAKEGDRLNFEPLLVADEDDKEAKVGTPTVAGASVSAVVLGEGRSRRIEVVKYKPKVRYHKAAGHRQHFTEIRIEEVKG